MKIQLKYPFSKDYKAGYVNTNKEPRRIVLLVRPDNTKTSVSYARYKMSCYLGRYLDKNEHVDHIDNNQLHDSLSNLQILSPKENNAKGKNKTITLICPICGNSFIRLVSKIKYKINNGKILTCSRSCGGKMSHKNK